jgi:hypothetical protein
MARRGALTVARRNLLEAIAAEQGPDSLSVVEIAEGRHGSKLGTIVTGWLRGADVVSETWDEDSATARVTIRIDPTDLAGLISSLASAQAEGRLVASAGASAGVGSEAASGTFFGADSIFAPATSGIAGTIISWSQITLHLIAAMLLIGLWATWSQNTP